jgi:hypothetical protein
MMATFFSSRSENTDFPAWPVPAETPAGFPFKEGWIDVGMAPFISYAVFLVLGAEIARSRPDGGSLLGMGCFGILPDFFSTATGGAYVLQFGMYAPGQ